MLPESLPHGHSRRSGTGHFDFPGDFLITCGRSNGSFAQGLPDALQIPSRLPREEVEALRRCIDWLQRLERGENVIVNLRLDTDVETEFVRFDRPRVVRVLERIAADLDNLSLVPDDPQADREVNQMILKRVVSWRSRHGSRRS
jgi:hypothetical protein